MKKLTENQRYLSLLAILLLIKAIWALFEISTGSIGLDPDEAQYWTWSQNLALGFYSKPPGIAWQVWLGCKLFGQTELGVRFFAAIISLLSSFAIYLVAHLAKLSPRLSFWSALIFAFSPIGMMGAFAATTDGAFILFLILALCPIVYALERKLSPNYLQVGLFIFCGALFKWTIFAIWIPILIAAFIYRPLFNKKLFLGALISFLGLLPSLFWNMENNWVTFKHIATQTTTSSVSQANFLSFFGAQIAILSPIFFVLLILGLIKIFRNYNKIKPSLVYCAFVTTLILVAYLGLSTVKKIQPNWALYAYPTSTLIIAWYAIESLNQKAIWLVRGTALSLALVFIMISIPFVQQKSYLSAKLFPFKVNPFRRCVGWSELKKSLEQIPYQEEENFLFSDTYQMTSLLSFYGPEQKRQYFLNTENRRQNQFCFWPTMAEEKVGKTGYYIWSKNSKNFLNDIDFEERKVKKQLCDYFESVELIKMVPLFESHGTLVKGALIFKCSNYNGKMPEQKLQY